MEERQNEIELTGKLSELTKQETKYGIFYSGKISCVRNSGVTDTLLVTIPEAKFLVAPSELEGKTVSISGQIRTRAIFKESGKNKLQIEVFTNSLHIVPEDWKRNEFVLMGFICKKTILRKTPLGKVIVDFILAVHRPYNKSDYIPCIVWGMAAEYMETKLNVGDKITVIGRLQSREYKKVYDDGTSEIKVAYEASIGKLEKVSQDN